VTFVYDLLVIEVACLARGRPPSSAMSVTGFCGQLVSAFLRRLLDRCLNLQLIAVCVGEGVGCSFKRKQVRAVGMAQYCLRLITSSVPRTQAHGNLNRLRFLLSSLGLEASVCYRYERRQVACGNCWLRETGCERVGRVCPRVAARANFSLARQPVSPLSIQNHELIVGFSRSRKPLARPIPYRIIGQFKTTPEVFWSPFPNDHNCLFVIVS
jgi:hypothetical protein